MQPQEIDTTTLSDKSIRKLFSYEKRKHFNVEMTLQILSLIKMEGHNNGEIYTAVLSDSFYKYKNFVIKKNPEDNLERFNIIEILGFHSTEIKSEKNPIFVISKYRLVSTSTQIIGQPTSINSTTLSKESPDCKENLPSTSNEQIHVVQSKGQAVISNIPKDDALLEKRAHVLTCDEHGKAIPIPKNCMPLSQLNTFTKDLLIHVRVIKISELKNFTSNRGHGCLFSFIILDSEGTEMQVTCFNKSAENYYKLIKLNSTYLIRGGFVKVNDHRFNSTKSDFKIVLEEKASVQEIPDSGLIKQFSLELVKLVNILDISIGSIIDAMGCVIEIHDKQHKTTKNGEYFMRKIFIVDDSLFKIELTLWKTFANLDVQLYDSIVIKNAKVGDFNGKNLATFEDTQVLINPQNMEIAKTLRQRISNYKGEFKTMTSTGTPTTSMSTNLQIYYTSDVLFTLNKFILSNSSGETQISQIRSRVTNFTHGDKNIYPGCPDQNCKKKLVEKVYSSGFNCSSCNTSYDKPSYYYNISIIIKDSSCEYWLDLFGNIGEKLLGVSADEYKKIIESKDEVKLSRISSRVDYKCFVFTVKPRMSNYNNVLKKKLNVQKIDDFDLSLDAKRMLNNIKENF